MSMYQKKRRQVGNRSKYVKIPMKTKLRFLRMVIVQRFSVKDAAAIFKINYSTSKTLIRQYKLDHLLFDINPQDDSPTIIRQDKTKLQRCTYLELKNVPDDKFEKNQSGTSLFYLQEGVNNGKEGRNISGVICKIEIISCVNN